jgi:hypothetical protein
MFGVATYSTSSSQAATPCSASRSDHAQSTWLAGNVSTAATVDYFRFATGSTRWTLIKLGNMKARLRLRLYNSSCQLLDTSEHSGTHFDQIYRSLAAGHYYLGVSGVSGATGTYDVKFWPLGDGVHLLSSHAYITSYRSNLLEVDGEVLNNLSHPNFFRYVNVDFYDAAGHVVAKAQGGFFDDYVGARSRQSFSVQLQTSKPYVRYTVSTITESPGSYPPLPAVTIRPGAETTDSQGDEYYPGHITNRSKERIIVGSVAVTLYDTWGNVDYLNSDSISPITLNQKATGTFDVEFLKPSGVNAAYYKLVY